MENLYLYRAVQIQHHPIKLHVCAFATVWFIAKRVYWWNLPNHMRLDRANRQQSIH